MSFFSLSPETVAASLRTDAAFQAFLTPFVSVTFAIVSRNHDATESALTIEVVSKEVRVTTSESARSEFSLVAAQREWENFFQREPELGYQSFWAMYLPQNDVIPAVASVTGDTLKFAQYASVWRTALDAIHVLLCGPPIAEDAEPAPEYDHIVGRYVYLNLPTWGGRCKVYYEQSGSGDHDILFLHTAGSDGRQYHGVMNDDRMLPRIRMTVFDLPGHGRSFPPPGYLPGQHYNSEERYLEVIGALIKALKLHKTIVCGASMAGLICIGVALRNDLVGAAAVIPVQGCEHVDMDRVHWDKDPLVNQALFCAEFTGGMMAPQSPAENKRLVWHIYSAQAYGMYSGDLDFYFGGFDYRGKVSNIDTSKVPVAMLTGAMDFSCRPEMSTETARKIKGAWIKIMPHLGHFPATEAPRRFTTHLLEALDHVEARI